MYEIRVITEGGELVREEQLGEVGYMEAMEAFGAESTPADGEFLQLIVDSHILNEVAG